MPFLSFIACPDQRNNKKRSCEKIISHFFTAPSLFSNSTASRKFNMRILRISCLWSENVQLQRMNPREAVPSRLPKQVLSAPFGKLRRFCPIYDFSSDSSAVSRSSLQADTGVIRLQPYLRQTSLDFPKWECLALLPTSHG